MADSQDSYHIGFCTGLNRDLKYLAVLIRSIARHFSEPEKLQFHFFHFQLSTAELDLFRQSLVDLPTPEPTLYSIEALLGSRVGEPGFGFFAWLWLFEMLPDSIDRLLYLDCDVLCYRDLAELWQLDLDDAVCALVPDPGARLHHCVRELRRVAPNFGFSFPPDRTYFNAGVVLVNVRPWKKLRIPRTVDDVLAGNYEALRLHDQDLLNLLIGDRALALSPEWNLLESIILYENWDFELYHEFDPRRYFEPRLRHFSGNMKPDGPNVRASEAEDYFSYLAETAWQHRRAFNLARLIKGHLLDFHYLVVRGLKQRVLGSPWRKLAGVVRRAPFVLVLYPALPLYRAFLRFQAGKR